MSQKEEDTWYSILKYWRNKSSLIAQVSIFFNLNKIKNWTKTKKIKNKKQVSW